MEGIMVKSFFVSLILLFSTVSYSSADQENCEGTVENYVFSLLNLDGITNPEYCEPLSVSCLYPLEVEEKFEDGGILFLAVYETNSGGYGNYYTYKIKVNRSCEIKNISLNHH